ncbi:MAG TPA: hypothetical protein PKB09_04445 [Candidatus Saccharibacteria bacterium]|nr:hypothetical protein [Candidatus Saccharibacteria bacterium]
MKNILKRIFSKRNLMVLFVVVVIGLFAYILNDLKAIRRDLYAVRDDYYNLNNKQEDPSKYAPTYTIVSQEVKNIGIYDDKANINNTSSSVIYKPAKVRVVKVEAKNNTKSVQTADSGGLGYADKNGVVVMPVQVDPKDDLNEVPNTTYAQIIPGGSTQFYIYFLDTGKNIESLYSNGFYSGGME